MKSTYIESQESVRRRQIGRKVLQADRLSRALYHSKQQKPKYAWRVPSIKPKVIAVLCVAVISIAGLIIGASQYYNAQAVVAQKAAAAKQQSKLVAKGIAADACRRKKVAEKASQIGKLTYDELYDHNDCNR